MSYKEDNISEFGITNIWHNANILDSIKTNRDTLVEMIERPFWGVACYMNNSIQSCTIDERFYHEALVHPVMSVVKVPKRVCIIGGGEGATAREVLKFSEVEHIDMYEWDEAVVNLFKNRYPQWAKGAWDDSRLRLHYVDIFEAIMDSPHKESKYDVIIIDLFEPTKQNMDKWSVLLERIYKWLAPNGAIVMYAGMRNILVNIQPSKYIQDILTETYDWHGVDIPKLDNVKDITPYRVWIPSFSGESMFLLLTEPHNQQLNFEKLSKIQSHITNAVWDSYKTMNW